MMDQSWFEMLKMQKRDMNRAVWIPLHAEQTISIKGEHGHLGFCEEYFGSGSLALYLKDEKELGNLNWDDLGDLSHGPYVTSEVYIESDKFVRNIDTYFGQHLVLIQNFDGDDPVEWHLHQDMVFALKLKREGDFWIKPDEGFEQVVKLTRSEDGRPVLIEIKAEYLVDYLCARKMVLALSLYRSRIEIVKDRNHIKWNNEIERIEEKDLIWEGRITPIHEGGMSFGADISVIHAGRIDIDHEEDIPEIGYPSENGLKSETWTIKSKGQKLYRIHGKLWKDEKIYPGEYSERVRKDKISKTVSFITDAKGTMKSIEALANPPIFHLDYLWFRPEIAMLISNKRGGSLIWYTKYTGGLKLIPSSNVHFGVNKIGLINVLAKDIALLPPWQLRLWSGHNVSPDGGVSSELQDSQIGAAPAHTFAPENLLLTAYNKLNELSNTILGQRLFPEHSQKDGLFEKVHRFRAVDEDGLFALAKDLHRLIGDDINTKLLKKYVKSKKEDGSKKLNLFEQYLSEVDPNCDAYKIFSPLHGIKNLRQMDSHLPGSQKEESFSLLDISLNDNLIAQAMQMIERCASTLTTIAKIMQDNIT